MSRADMESATPECQSLQAAGKLPEGLSASSSAVVNLFAMMVDHLCASEGGLNVVGWLGSVSDYAGISNATRLSL
jgi:hypothetical protein